MFRNKELFTRRVMGMHQSDIERFASCFYAESVTGKSCWEKKR